LRAARGQARPHKPKVADLKAGIAADRCSVAPKPGSKPRSYANTGRSLQTG